MQGKNEKQSWWRRFRWLLLSFFIPFFIATIGYHFVYVSDSGVRSMGLDQQYPGIPTEKAVEMEEHRRLQDVSAWGVHAVVMGLPAGLLVSILVATARLSIRLIRSRTRDDAA